MELLCISKLLILFIRMYQNLINPFMISCCRFNPSCSSYAIQMLARFNLCKALFLIIIRIFKCNPLSSGDYNIILNDNGKTSDIDDSRELK